MRLKPGKLYRIIGRYPTFWLDVPGAKKAPYQMGDLVLFLERRKPDNNSSLCSRYYFLLGETKAALNKYHDVVLKNVLEEAKA
jgi:hypothetical protein